MKIWTSLICAAACALSSAAVAEVMTNITIINLAKAGLSEQVIIDKINSEPCGYDVSTDGIISLKRAGLPEGVISAMVRRCATLAGARGVAGDDSSGDPKVRHSPGIYVVENWASPNVLQKLRPSKSNGVRTSGNGSILMPLVAKLMIAGTESHVPVLSPSPVFYFYFNPSDTSVSDFGQENSVAAQSPSEFTLVRFRLKGDSRELDMGKMAAYGGSIVSYRKGINPKSALKTETEEQGSGIFKVTVPQPLENGEYAFVFNGANGSARIYDFSVRGGTTNPAAPK